MQRNQMAKGKYQKAKVAEEIFTFIKEKLLPPFCLLTFDICLLIFRYLVEVVGIEPTSGSHSRRHLHT
jgi:hypothetical protein